jgi:HEPN domain-containing protein
MITQTQLRETALERLHDAEVLFAAGRWDGAIYICGYAVEIALKAKICTTSSWLDFPSSSNEFRSISDFIRDLKTHDLEKLLSFSGEITTIRTNYLAEWSVVSKWDPESRYNPSTGATSADAQSMIDSAKAILHVLGVL